MKSTAFPVFLVLLAAVLFPLVLVIGRHRPNRRAYFAWMLCSSRPSWGAFLSLDLSLISSSSSG